MSSDVHFCVPASVEKNEAASAAPANTGGSRAENFPKLAYEPPPKSCICGIDYTLDVLKNGVIIENLLLSSKAFYVFGRLPQPACDVPLEHPSISRYHAILQFIRNEESNEEGGDSNAQLATGWYVYDLGSTHGTFVNKQRAVPRTYLAVKTGDFLRFGASTRQFILQAATSEIDEPESEPKQEKQKDVSDVESNTKRESDAKPDDEANTESRAESKSTRKSQKKAARSERDANFCDWGFDEDAAKGAATEIEADALAIRELKYTSHYSNDPKRFLKRYFEHELGDEPNYEIVGDDGDRDRDEPVSERAFSNQQNVRLQLPILDELGRPVTIEVVRSGKRRDAIAECARDACEYLDRAGELDSLMSGAARSSHRRKRAAEWAADDYYDSDEDLYTDRTGELEKKRSDRMKRLGAAHSEVDTFETLTVKLNEIDKQIASLRTELSGSVAQNTAEVQLSSSDDLLRHVEAGNVAAIADKVRRSQNKARLISLEQDRLRIVKLIRVVQPVSFTFAANCVSTRSDSNKQSDAAVKNNGDQLPLTDDRHATRSETDRQEAVTTENETKVPVLEKTPDSPKSDVKVSAAESEAPRKSAIASSRGTSATRLKLAVSRTVTPKEPSKNTPRLAARDVQEEFESDPEDVTNSVPISRHTAAVLRNNDEVPLVTEKHSYWVPPTNQSGDGRTSMNDKLGY